MTNPKEVALTRVLVATDLEATSLEALRTADRIVRASGGSLSVVTALSASPSANDAARREAETQRRAEAETHVREATGREPSEYTLFVDSTLPADAIVARAQEIAASLVVVGTHDRARVQRWLVGSVAQKVLRDAPCSVLVARPSPLDGCVLAACQLDEVTPDVVRWGSKIAGGTRLVLLHTVALGVSDVTLVATAIFSGAVPPTPTREAVDSIREMAHGALEAELSDASAKGEVEVKEGVAGPMIIARGQALGASLVVLGSHGRRGLSRLALGSTAGAVARDAASSVLVVR